MDLLELGDMGRRCEDENCSFPSGFPENCSNQECYREEPIFGLIELVCVTVIYIPLMVFGLLGNTLTILVVWLRPHMRSSTYLYLSSMAVSDLLILLLLPLDLYKLWRPRPWPLGDLVCKVTMFLSECCTFCTILHITFLSLERYLAVCWPITAKILVTRSRTKALIGCLWLGAVVSAAPVLVMVGVEDVGIEELGVGGWRESGGLTSREGEQGGFMMDGSGHTVLTDGGPEGINWEEKEKKGWDERVGEWFEEKGERKLAIRDRNERKQGDEGGSKEEERMEVEGEQQNKMKEDEGGGRDEGVDGGYGGGSDNRECRCTHYAVTSGLLSAMTIVSNLYFLVPLCILGLVYSLIGRTLWLRPQSSRRDQSHRHTVKMLGVIVLAFVLCWLPFHVGRTIFSLSLGSGSDGQETYPDTNSHLDINTPSDISTDRNINTHAGVGMHMSDTQTHTDINTQSDDLSTDKHLHSHVISHTRGQHMNSGTSTHKLDHTHTAAHAEIHNDTTNDDTQLGRFTDNRDTNNHKHNSTNTTTNNGTQITHIVTQVSHLNTSFHNVTTANTRTNRLSCTDLHTLTSMQNTTPISINSQNSTLNHTPPTAGTNTYAVTPTNLYNDTHNDTHLYFLYYLSQYFNLASSVLFYLSAAVNPLLYNLMSARYRHAVHSLIYTQSHTPSHTPSHRLHTLTAQHSTTTL